MFRHKGQKTVKVLQKKKKTHKSKSWRTQTRQCFSDMTLKAQSTKGKIDKLDFIKLKAFCASKNTIKEMKQ